MGWKAKYKMRDVAKMMVSAEMTGNVNYGMNWWSERNL